MCIYAQFTSDEIKLCNCDTTVILSCYGSIYRKKVTHLCMNHIKCGFARLCTAKMLPPNSEIQAHEPIINYSVYLVISRQETRLKKMLCIYWGGKKSGQNET
jgi:hypothetical protein